MHLQTCVSCVTSNMELSVVALISSWFFSLILLSSATLLSYDISSVFGVLCLGGMYWLSAVIDFPLHTLVYFPTLSWQHEHISDIFR